MVGARVLGEIQFLDVINMFFIYIAIFVLRFAQIAFSYPMLKNMGKSCTLNETFFMAFGGLRGNIIYSFLLIYSTFLKLT